MTVTARPTPTTAPPDDPVRVALEDPVLQHRIKSYARAALRGHLADADDVVQLVAARAWERRTTFDPSAGSVTSWLFGITNNVIRELSRRRSPAATDPAVLADDLTARVDREPDLDDLRFRVEKYLNRLPVEFRTAVSLRYLDDADYPEIAERLMVSRVNARMKVSRGLKLLRQFAASNPKEDRS